MKQAEIINNRKLSYQNVIGVTGLYIACLVSNGTICGSYDIHNNSPMAKNSLIDFSNSFTS